ncbi:MAG: hypothetical protein HFE51_11090 [Clostridia bacterium]|nr:hypothetical protein [Clostridia bacterium]
MDSFAFSYKPSDINTNEPLVATMNFNLWALCDWDKDTVKLDIGFKLENLSSSKEVCIYIPVEIEENDITDLGTILSQDVNLIGAIFNENYQIKTVPNNKKITVQLKDKPEFIVYSLDIKTDLRIESFEKGGKLIYIKVDKIVDKGDACDTYYFRFRLETPELKKILKEYPSKNQIFESLAYYTYSVDFRFNNRRSMDNSLIEKMNNGNTQKFVNIKKIHFLLMSKIYVDVESNVFNDSNYSARILEDNIWSKYLFNDEKDHTEDIRDIVAYHIKRTEEKYIDSYEFFTKLRVGKCSKKTIVIYLAVLLLFTVYCNGVTNAIFSFIPIESFGLIEKIIITSIIGLSFPLLFGLYCIIIFIKKKLLKTK